MTVSGRAQRLAERHRLGRIGALVRGAAIQRIGVSVVAGDGLRCGDAAGEARVLIALEAQRDDDDRIGRRRQGCARARGRQRRRGWRSEGERGVAAEQRGFFLAHGLLQKAQRRRGVEVLVAFGGGFGFEGHRVFFAERQVGCDLELGGIGHAGGALAFRHPTHRVVARAQDRGDGAPTCGVARVDPSHAGQRVPQRSDDRIEVLGRRLEVIGGKAGGQAHVLGERVVRQRLLGEAQGFFGCLQQNSLGSFLKS